MIRKYHHSFFGRHAGLILAAAFVLFSAAHAAPGNLTQIPLFLGTAVPPNIFFVLDDSGSMDWEVLKSPGAETAHPDFSGVGALNPAPSSEIEILEYCVGYNLLAYDPTVTYMPWEGEDSAGNAFSDLTLATARDNPYETTTTDISDRFYFPWNDDGDGEYDLGECPRPDPAEYGDTIDADDCPAAGCVRADSASVDQENFSNWFSYYRTREHVLKRAVSAVISDSEDRLGIASLNDNGLPSTPISDMSAPLDPLDPSACGAGLTNKDCLLRRLFQLDASTGGGTSLRRALDEAGKYFDDTDSDGHEYLETAGNPILDSSEGGTCQQNFTVLVSDGFWNQSWDGSYGDADSGGGGDSIDSPWDGGAQADGSAADGPDPEDCDSTPITVDTLADIAMHFYEKDLFGNATDDIVNPIPGIDPNRAQHMVTFAVSFGGEGTLTSNPPNRADSFPWPPVCPDTLWTVDDMRHAAWNGRGQFLSARSPASIAQVLTDTVAAISQRRANTSTMAFNTSSLSSSSLVFQATFDSEDWSGDLSAYNAEALLADVEADGVIDIAPLWSAADELDALTNAQARDRVALTLERDGSPGSTRDGVAAAWANLTAAQQADLRTNGDASAGTDEVGEARLNYLLGDRSCEIGGEGSCGTDINADGSTNSLDKSLRERGSRLGDIVNAGPVVVGIPELNWPSTAPFPEAAGDTYADFKAGLTASPREEVVYVGANDGMLHGFRTSDGQEVLAYLPASLASGAVNEGYHRLSDPLYTHRFYVDRTPAVSDVYIATTVGGATAWRTLAVGGLGAGGRGLYALDITDPAPTNFTRTNAADLVLWEFTDGDDPELGFTVGEPVIAMMNNGEWAAIVSSGYNDNGPDPDAHLFILFLEEGLDGVWTLGTDYLRLEAPEDPTLVTAADRNGLSSPVVADLDGNGTADRVYAGDLFGNLWAFDLCDADADGECSASTADWEAANAGLSPLFTAEVAGQRQPITHKPVISKHPTEPDAGNQPNVMVYFGTGQYLVDTDLTSTDPQSFYGVWDRGTFSRTRVNLQEQTFDSNFANNQVLTDNAVDWSTEFGWYIDLPDTGERVVVDPVLRGGILFFNSLVPSTDPCAGGGTSFLYAVDMETGGRPDFAPFDRDDDGVVDLNDLLTSGSDTAAASRKVYAGGSGGVATKTQVLGDKAFTGLSNARVDVTTLFELDRLDKGRLSWQELNVF